MARAFLAVLWNATDEEYGDMSSVEVTLEEQLSDLRSNHIAYKLIIRNTGASSVLLFSISPRVPMGSKLIEITDRSLAEVIERRVELLEDLNKLVRQFLWVESEAFREAWIERQRDAYKRMVNFSSLAKFYGEIAKLGPKDWLARMEREFAVMEYKITSTQDARSAIARWLKDAKEDSIVASLISAKTDQLESIESLMNESQKSSMAIIEPASEFTSTYVLRFDRSVLEPRKYQVSFDIMYAGENEERAQHTAVATNVQISPYALPMSLVAVCAALLGSILEISNNLPDQKAGSLWRAMQESASALIAAPILALVFFNTYEHTALGNRLRIPLGWRSALLIGVLCGVMQNNILAAIKALIGT